MDSRRIDRIEGQLRAEIGEIIEREIQDPRVGLATITSVKVSPDLRHARIFVTVLGDTDEQHKTLEGLKSAASYIRRSLSQRLHHLKRIPDLTFGYDEGLERSMRVEELLDKIKLEEQ